MTPRDVAWDDDTPTRGGRRRAEDRPEDQGGRHGAPPERPSGGRRRADERADERSGEFPAVPRHRSGEYPEVPPAQGRHQSGEYPEVPPVQGRHQSGEYPAVPRDPTGGWPERRAPEPGQPPYGRPVPAPRQHPGDTGENRRVPPPPPPPSLPPLPPDDVATEHIPVINDESRAGRRSATRGHRPPNPTGRAAPPTPAGRAPAAAPPGQPPPGRALGAFSAPGVPGVVPPGQARVPGAVPPGQARVPGVVPPGRPAPGQPPHGQPPHRQPVPGQAPIGRIPGAVPPGAGPPGAPGRPGAGPAGEPGRPQVGPARAAHAVAPPHPGRVAPPQGPGGPAPGGPVRQGPGGPPQQGPAPHGPVPRGVAGTARVPAPPARPPVSPAGPPVSPAGLPVPPAGPPVPHAGRPVSPARPPVSPADPPVSPAGPPVSPARPPGPRPSPAGDGGPGERSAPRTRAERRRAETEAAREVEDLDAPTASAGVAEALGSIADAPSAGLAEALGSIAGPDAAPRSDAAPENEDQPEPDVDALEPVPGPVVERGQARVRPPAEAASAPADGDDSDGPGLDVTVDPLFSGTREIRTGRRAALRRELDEVRRVRTATVILLVLAVLGAPLTFYAIREAARDPVFGHLSALEVPGWAARDPQDETTGSRWCIGQCRLRQRILRSERTPEETSAVFTTALRKAGWVPWKIEGCPPQGQQGVESCWQRDEYVLDLWVYQPECEVQLKVPDPSQPATPLAEAVCPPTVVTLKVINKVSFEGGA